MKIIKPVAFIAMSFSKEYYDIFNCIEAVVAINNYYPYRIDESEYPLKNLQDSILRSIKEAQVFIAEISSDSKNVFYEVGWAHALRIPTMLLVKKGVDIPFDVETNQIVIYDPEENPQTLKKILDLEFKKHFSNIIKNSLNKSILEMFDTIEKIYPKDDLFAKILRLSIDESLSESKMWVGDSLHVSAVDAIKKGIKVFQLMTEGGFATYLVPINAYWNSNDKYSQECRIASERKKKKIERVFIIQNYEALTNQSLLEHIAQDEKAGIKTYIALVNEIKDSESIKDFGIWDDQLVCLIETNLKNGDPQVSGCTFGRDKKMMETAKSWRESIMLVAKRSTDFFEKFEDFDLPRKHLLYSISRMEDYSEKYCKGSYISDNEDGCCWYHSSWQYLRYLKMVSTPEWHKSFYLREFSDAINNKCEKILICGLADYAILESLLNAIPIKKIKNIDFFVLDTCGTPIEITKWFAKMVEKNNGFELNIEYQEGNALKLSLKDETFDLITSDAFLTRFNYDQKRQIINEWFRLLKPNGKVVTTSRLSLDGFERLTKPSQQEKSDFVSRAKQRAIEDPFLHSYYETVVKKASLYAENIFSYPFGTNKDAEDLFARFQTSIEVGKTPGEFSALTRYLRISATKQ